MNSSNYSNFEEMLWQLRLSTVKVVLCVCSLVCVYSVTYRINIVEEHNLSRVASMSMSVASQRGVMFCFHIFECNILDNSLYKIE